ncbi:uncharacterized protein BDZ99DRAFT_244613 [Mytilinidion resinicola]|uniref:Uncharacterized protein n=1 Tax=Mytilinidion resinicola TaxID=574789 RepID=A0A6A6YY97_9PEZI|nr:uncharacterized protein BDZ99DRAFT_244613 [Mytilinidion resinicola]KAF2812917.1 hypothetical protein BDZ99DRAFT_244613 [Mytilinidion resinicola]
MSQPQKISHMELQQRTLDTVIHIFLRFPRELRDQIYSYLFTYSDSQPINLAYSHLTALDPNIDPEHHLSSRWVGPLLASEMADSFYGLNAFAIASSSPLNQTLSFCRWGSGVMPSAFLRQLSVEIIEDSSSNCVTSDSDQSYEQESVADERRAKLACLLHIPRLEKLELRIQKIWEGPLEIRDVNPLIHQLCQQHPRVEIKLAVSFDNLLQEAWDSWEPEFGNGLSLAARQAHYVEEFKPAGFSDCTELIAPPSEEDRKHVEEFTPHMIMPRSRRATAGLVDEDVATRKMLQGHYACQEPALMRVNLERHWEVWQKLKKSESSL